MGKKKNKNITVEVDVEKKYEEDVTVNINDQEVTLDKSIAKDIVKLNKKGYETLFCCSGHKEKLTNGNTSYSCFYVIIKIKKDFDYNRFFKNFPRELHAAITLRDAPKAITIGDDLAVFAKEKDRTLYIRAEECIRSNWNNKKLDQATMEFNDAIARNVFHRFVKDL